MQSFNIGCTLYSCCCIWRAAFIDFWRDNVYCCDVMSFATWNLRSPVDWITGWVDGDKKTRETPFELVVNYSSLQKRRKNYLIAIFRFAEIISTILLLLFALLTIIEWWMWLIGQFKVLWNSIPKENSENV